MRQEPGNLKTPIKHSENTVEIKTDIKINEKDTEKEREGNVRIIPGFISESGR